MNKIPWMITEILAMTFVLVGYIYESISTSFIVGREINKNHWNKYGK